jgi:hypothetical protein
MFDDTQMAPEPIAEEVVQQEPAQEAALEQPKVDPQASFRALREKTERLERERNEAVARAQQLEQERSKVVEEDEEFHLGADDLAEGKHLSKVQKKIKRLEDQLQQYEQKNLSTSTELRLKNQYPDFDAVVSPDNIERLKLQYPEIAQTLHSSHDLYSTAVSAYTIIKRLGIHQEDAYANERAIAQKNAAKPRPLASVSAQQGDSPLSHANAFANGLTPELQKQLHREMMEARRSN